MMNITKKQIELLNDVVNDVSGKFDDEQNKRFNPVLHKILNACESDDKCDIELSDDEKAALNDVFSLAEKHNDELNDSKPFAELKAVFSETKKQTKKDK